MKNPIPTKVIKHETPKDIKRSKFSISLIVILRTLRIAQMEGLEASVLPTRLHLHFLSVNFCERISNNKKFILILSLQVKDRKKGFS